MQNVILSTVAITDLVDMLASEVESRLRRNPQTTPAPKPKVLSVPELQEYLPNNPPIATIYKWTHEGTIPHFKIGTRLSFRTSEIDQWLSQKRVPTIEEIRSAPIQSKKR
jgi:excisionase family DNA binding protein